MQETGTTKGWFTVGLTLIIIGGGLYFLATFFGLQYALQSQADAPPEFWLVLLIPGLVVLGFLVLLTKVIVDRLNSPEDDHYSKHVDK